MRPVHILFLAFLLPAGLSAQNDVDSTRLLHADRFTSDGYASGGFGVQQFTDGAGFFTELSANWVIDHRFVIGGVFRQVASYETVAFAFGEPADDARLRHMSAGLRLGYIVFHDKLFSLVPEVVGAWANAVYEFPEADVRRWNFAQIRSSVNVVFNGSAHVRPGLGLVYTRSIGVDLDPLDDAALSGVGARFFVRFGTF